MAEKYPSPLDLGVSTPLVPPLYQSSVYTLPDLDALDRIMNDQAPGFIYARDAHPNAQLLATRLMEMEGAQWGLVTGSGMGALSAILLATLQQGGRVVASNRLYGRTTQLLMQELTRFGVKATLVDVNDLEQVRHALDTPARLLLVETMSNPLLRVADIPRLAQLAHARDCLLVVDNTFATPALVRPLDLGADIVMESLTKMIGGHADITLGALCGKSDLLPELKQVISIWGLASNPFDCWLAERGLATLRLRMHQASFNAASLADWLADQPAVERVVYPRRADHPDYELATRLLAPPPAELADTKLASSAGGARQGNFGNMLCFDLAGGRDAVNRFLRRCPGIPFSPSLGNTTTTCSHPATTSHRYTSPAERQRQGITEGLVRLSVGIEDLAEIQRLMARGLR
jgi:cystathionine beta-lyase/cystathionine gamma-synthase